MADSEAAGKRPQMSITFGTRYRLTRIDGSSPPIALSFLDSEGREERTDCITEEEARGLARAFTLFADHCLCESHPHPTRPSQEPPA